MTKIKNILITFIVLLVLGSALKNNFLSALAFILPIILIIIKIYNKPKNNRKKLNDKLTLTDTNKMDINICDLIIFNAKDEIENTIKNIINEKIKIAISEFNKINLIKNDDIKNKFKDKEAYVLNFKYNTSFTYITKLLHSNLNAYLITNIDKFEYEVTNNISINNVALKINNKYVEGINDAILSDRKNYTQAINKNNYYSFRNYFCKIYSYNFPKNYESFMNDLKKDERVQSMIEDLYYNSHDEKEYAIIVDEKNMNFYSCKLVNYKTAKNHISNIKNYLILTSFNNKYKDSLGNIIELEID